MKTLRLTIIRAALATFALLALAGCGKSTSSTRPQAQSELPAETAQQIAQQASTLVLNGGLLADTRGMLATTFAPSGSKAARGPRPAATGRVDTDSTSGTWAIHAYDLSGQEVSWGSVPAEQLSHVTVAWDLYSSETSDTLSMTIHWTSAFDITGFAAAQSRWVFGGNMSFLMDYDYLTPPDRWISHSLAAFQCNSVAYEKSGTPAYPVAGSVSYTWQATWDYSNGQQHNRGSQDVACTLMFDGTVWAHVTVGTYHYTLNMETGELVPVSA